MFPLVLMSQTNSRTRPPPAEPPRRMSEPPPDPDPRLASSASLASWSVLRLGDGYSMKAPLTISPTAPRSTGTLDLPTLTHERFITM